MSTNAREYGQDGAHEKLAAQFVITQPGYVYIYISNDNAALGGAQIECYFDDMKIEQVKSFNARPWTGPRTLDRDGSFTKAITSRVGREIKRSLKMLSAEKDHDTKTSANDN